MGVTASARAPCSCALSHVAAHRHCRCRYSLLSRLALAFPAVDFSLVIGADLVPTLTSWKHAAQLLREIHFLVLARPGYDLRAALEKQPADTLPATFHIVEEASDVSGGPRHVCCGNERILPEVSG